jgi:hypothetical protein
MNGRFVRELSVWADFNALDQDHRIRTSLRFASEWPTEGDWVWLYDGEGNAVQGLVEAIDGLAVQVHAEMSTWINRADSIDTSFSSYVPFQGVMPQGAPTQAHA